jgi:hypothetical protein
MFSLDKTKKEIQEGQSSFLFSRIKAKDLDNKFYGHYQILPINTLHKAVRLNIYTPLSSYSPFIE